MERLHRRGPTAQEEAGIASNNTSSPTDAVSVNAQDTTPAQNEALIRAYIEAVFNGHHLDGLEKYWAEEMTSHWMGQETLRGLPAWREGMVGFFAAFPDAVYTLDDLFFAGDRGVWRGSWQATQRGAWEGSRPLGTPCGGPSSSWAVLPRVS